MSDARSEAERQTISEEWLRTHVPPRAARAHKGDFGRVLVVAGSLEYPGAAVLTGLGALRAGAGLVRVATAETVAARIAAAAPELTWLPLAEEAPGVVAPGGWRRLGDEGATYDAVVVGPGLGRLPVTLRRARALITGLRVPVVVDADGLNALATDTRWPRATSGPLVLTPHAGEFARLASGSTPDARDDAGREQAAADAARLWGHVVVLKGARTVIASPTGDVLLSTIATPALASAGTGDVLAGAIAAFLAAGVPPLEAAGCGVGLHAAAGLLAESRLGAAGTIATDIARLLPEVRRRLGGGRQRSATA